MGIPSTSVVQTPPSGDQANAVVTGAFTATGVSAPFMVRGPFNVSMWGTWAATVLLQRSFDGGTTWITRTDTPSGDGSFTTPGSFVVTEPEAGVIYQLANVFTSGTVAYRMSTTGTYPTARTPA